MGDPHAPESTSGLRTPPGADVSSGLEANPTVVTDPLVDLRVRRHGPLRPDERQALAALERRLFGSSSSTPSLSRYVLEERIGSGGAGVVFRAHDPGLDRKVAVKLVLPGTAPGENTSASGARLLREAQALAKLSHPNVVTVHDVGTYTEVDGEPGVFVVMELIDGPTLAEWLGRPRAFSEVVHHLLAAGRGLAAAHAAGLVHRDFKPQNVVLGRDGRVRVIDFGLVRPSVSQGESAWPDFGMDDGITSHGAIVGTPRYMSPEQHAGTMADARSDQFAFCLTFYEAIYHQRAFAGDTMEALAAAKTAGSVCVPPPDGAVPRGLFGVLGRGLAPNPADRYPDLEELLDALARQSERAKPIVGSKDQDLSPFSVRVHEVLAVVLGPHTAGRALALTCRRAGKPYGSLDESDREIVTRTLGPMLRTLAGRRVAGDIIDQIIGKPTETAG
jgi:serine/threonine protein kinase